MTRARRSPRLADYDYRQPGLYFVTVCTAGRACVFGEVDGGDMVLSPLGRVAHDEWGRTLALRPSLVGDSCVVMPNHVHVLFGIPGGDEAAGGGAEGGADDPRRAEACLSRVREEAEASLSPTNADGAKADGTKADRAKADGAKADGAKADGAKADGATSAEAEDDDPRRAEACLSQPRSQGDAAPHGVPPQSVPAIVGGYKAAVTRAARAAGLWADGPLWQARFHDRIVRDHDEADRVRRYVAENPAWWASDALHP